MEELNSANWRRLHPTFLLRPSLIWGPIVTFVPLFFFGLEKSVSEMPMDMIIRTLAVMFTIGLVGFFAVEIYLYLRIQYVFLRDRIVIRTGVFDLVDRVIRFDRLHGIDTRRSPLQRLWGTTILSFQTSSGLMTEGILNGIKLEVVDELRSLIDEHQRTNRHTIDADSNLAAQSLEHDASEDPLVRMTVVDCLKLAFIRTEAATLMSGIALFLVNRFDQLRMFWGIEVPTFDLGQIFQFTVHKGLVPWINVSLQQHVDPSELSIWLGSIGLTFILLIGLFAVVFAVLLYYRFKLVIFNEVAKAEAGLYFRSTQNTPLYRIQATKVVSTIRSRLIGVESIRFSTSGADGGQSNFFTPLTKWLVPILPPIRVREILTQAIPNVEFDVSTWQTIDVKTVWRRRLNLHLCYVLPTTVIFLLTSVWLLILSSAMLVWSVYFCRLFATNLRYQILDNAIMLKTGSWRRTWTTVPFEKIQNVTVLQTVFDRRFNMARVCVDAASTEFSFRRFALQIPYLDCATAHAIRRRLVTESGMREFEW